MSDDKRSISRRRLLGGLGTLGAAGALGGGATTSLLWDEEKFGNESVPNVLEGGALDLKVDWEEHYVDWIGDETEVDGVRMVDSPDDLMADEVGLPTDQNPLVAVKAVDTDGDDVPQVDEFMEATTIESSPLTDQPDPVVTLEDVKPGDFGEVTFSYHVFDNPGFVSVCGEVHADEDNGINEPEDKVNGHTPDDSDGTAGGDLGDLVQACAFYDPDCDNRIQGQETEVMLATDISESMDSDELPGAPSVDGEPGDASVLEGIKAAVGDADPNNTGFLTGLQNNCPGGVEIGAVSFSENHEYLDNDKDGDDGDPEGNDADGSDAMLDKALMDVGATNRAFNPNAGTDNGGADDYEELKLLFGADQDFTDDNEFVIDDNSPGTPFGGARYAPSIDGNDDYILGNGNDTFVAERPYTGDGDSTQDDGIVKAIQGLLPDGNTYTWSPGGPDIQGIDPSGNAAEPGEARKLVIYITDGSFGAVGEDDPDPVDPAEASAAAEDLGIEIKPILVNTNPSQNDVDFARAFATTNQDPFFVTSYDGVAPSDDDIDDAGFNETTLLDAMNACLSQICAGAGGGTKLAGPASFNEVISGLEDCQLLDPTKSGSAQAVDFGGLCHQPSQTGCIALAWWLPRDIPGVNDNIVQTDRLEFQISFETVQCRHNTNANGEPIQQLPEADDENNAQHYN